MRPASHAGSWYPSKFEDLQKMLAGMFSSVQTVGVGPSKSSSRLKALVSPHAGLPYSGPVASEGYAMLSKELKNSEKAGSEKMRFFIFGPSHTAFIDNKCLLPGFDEYASPYGGFSIDTTVRQNLLSSKDNLFGIMQKKVEIAEHSIEMQLPYSARALEEAKIPQETIEIVPILVGNLTESMEKQYASAFLPYWNDCANFFLFSGDFCHWGERFGYQYHYKKHEFEAIDDAISAMDREGISHLINKNLQSWYAYLRKTGNTICGEHPFGILLNIIRSVDSAGVNAELHLLGYDKSNVCANTDDSRVSYASVGVWV